MARRVRLLHISLAGIAELVAAIAFALATHPLPAAASPAKAVRPATPAAPVVLRIPEDGEGVEAIELAPRLPGAGIPGGRTASRSSMAASGAPVASAAIVEGDTSYTWFQHGFDRASDGACVQRGWTAQDRSTLVFAHVDNKHLLNDAFITMGDSALWFGADASSHPEEVAGWYYAEGFGNQWSQRLTSPEFTNGNLALTFDGRVGLSTSAVLSLGTPNTWLAVQGLRSDGSWEMLTARWAVSTGQALTTSRGVRGFYSFKCTVPTHPDSQSSFPFASPARLRIVMQSTSFGSNEDGSIPTKPGGGAVVDNVRLRNLGAGADPIALNDFENGTTGAWTLSACNGGLTGTTTVIRDVAPPGLNPSVESDFDPNHPSCLWQFTGASGFVGRGALAYLTSPWFAREPGSDTTLAVVARIRLAPGATGFDRHVSFAIRGKSAGDSHAARLWAHPGYVIISGVGSDLESPDFTYELGTYDNTTHVGSIQCDSLQISLLIWDAPERYGININSLPDTRLPWFDDIRVVQYGGDSDSDGVGSGSDLCPTECAAGQDADRDGCIDATATLRHVETWRAGDRPIHFRLSQEGDPGIGDGSDLQALRDAFAAWEGVAGADVDVVEDAPTSQTNASGTDGINLLTFEDDYAFPGNVLAVTPTMSFTQRAPFDDVMRLPGEILDADIMFNPAVTFRTATAGPASGSYDLKSVAAHEIGHLLGLSHSGAADATMFPVLQSGTLAASLESDDASAIAAAYPGATLLSGYGKITGHLTRGGNGAPVPGALVMAIRFDTGVPVDTVATDYTDENGRYALYRLAAGEYGVRVAPLDGSVPAVIPGAINAWVESIAETNFKPEWYGGPETNNDDPDVRASLVVTAGGATVANVITNIDVTAPTVMSVSPGGAATGVRIDTPILVTFSEAVVDTSLGQAFKLRPSGGGASLGGSGQLLTPGLSFVFVPADPLAFNTRYVVELTTALKDVEGNALAVSYADSFTTQLQPPVSIGDMSPREAPQGALVTLTGTGYDAQPGAQNKVFFSNSGGFGSYVLGTNVTPTSMVAEVPGDAVSGPVKVEVGGSESNLFAFSLLTSDVEAPSPNGDAVSVGFPPGDVALSPDGRTAYAVGSGGLARINLEPLRPFYRQAVNTGLGNCRSVALLPSGVRAYVTRPGSGQVLEVDADPQSGTFGQQLAAIALPGRPAGIAIAASGQRAYVTDDSASVVYELDVDATSALYRKLRREISVAGAVLAGGIALDPGRDRLVLSTTNLGLVAVDLDTTTLVITISAAGGGGGVAVTPGSGRVIACASASNEENLLYGGLLGGASGAVEVGGAARDVAVSPDGATALVANGLLGRLQVVDVTQPSPRLVANVATGGTPVAVAVSGGGAQVAVANFAGKSIGFYNVVSTATPVRVTPPVASAGDRVAIAVTGGALAVGTTVETSSASAAAIQVVPAAVSFQVPAVSASVTSVTLVANGTRSLALPFEIVDPIATLDPRAMGVALDPVDMNCGAGAMDGALRVVRVSPDGHLVAVSREGPTCARVDVYQAIPSGSTPLGARVVDGASFAGVTAVYDLAFTPDGRRLWVAGNATGLFELNVDTDSPGLGSVLPFGGASVGTARALASDPMGRYVMVGTEVTPGTHQLQPWTPARSLAGAVALPGPARSLAVTPDGRYAVVGGQGRAHLVDLASLTLLGSTPAHSVVPPDDITSLVVTTDSRHAVGLFPGSRIGVWNVDPSAGAVGSELYFGAPTVPGTLSTLAQASDGHGVLAGCTDCNSLTRITPAASPVVASATLGQPSRALARSVDGRTLWIADWNEGTRIGGVTAFTLSPGTTFALVAGAGQSAAASQALPLPVRVHLLDDASGHDVPGALVRFTLAGSDQGALDGGVLQVVKPTDAAGEAEVSWTMPPAEAGVLMTVSALGIAGGTIEVGASSTIDESVALPAVIETGPPDGASDVLAAGELFVRFSQRMDSTSVDSGLVVFANGGGMPRKIRLQNDGRTVFVKPFAPLSYGAACEIQVSTLVRDLQGQELPQPASSYFTVQAPPTLAIRALSPPSAPPGATITLNGEGFSAFPVANTVSFNGVVSPVTSASSVSLVTTVPAAAASGPLTVSVGASTSLPASFVVLDPDPTPLRIGVEADVRQGIEGIAIEPSGRRAYITLPGFSCVLAFDIDRREVIKTIPVGLKPQAIAIDPEGRRAYVVNTGSDNVSVIDIDPLSADYHRALTGPAYPIRVGARPVGIVGSAFGPTMLVVNEAAGTISVINANASAGTFDHVTATIRVGTTTKSVSVTPDGTRAYVATEEGIKVVDIASGAVTSTIRLPSGGKTVSVSPDGTLLFALGENGDLHVIDIAPGSATYNQVTKTITPTSGGRSVSVSPDGTLLYLTVRDLDLALVYRIVRGAAGGAGGGVAPGPATSLELIESVVVGDGPSGLAVLPDGSSALVVNEGSGTVSVLRADSQFTAVAELPVAPLRFGVFPTPSVGAAKLHFTLTRRAAVELDVFDLQGRLVRRLVREVLPAGAHTVTWRGERPSATDAGPGIYFARMRAEGRTLQARVLLLR